MNVTELTPDSNGIVTWPNLSSVKKAVITVGVFDGVHKGHRKVLRQTVNLAKQLNCLSAVIMFTPRPALLHRAQAKSTLADSTVHYHDNDNIFTDNNYNSAHLNVEQGTNGNGMYSALHDDEALMSIRQRLRIMEQLGIDHVLVVHYTLAFAAKSFRFFIGQLVGKLGMRMLVLGEDARMGANGAGDITAIGTLAQATGVFELSVVRTTNEDDDVRDISNNTVYSTKVSHAQKKRSAFVRLPIDFQRKSPSRHGEPQDPTTTMTKAELRAFTKQMHTKVHRDWSSTHIRYLLSQARISDANAILGMCHAIEGAVVDGDKRGRELGFPTANLGGIIDGYIPADGVYAGWIIDFGKNDEHVSLADERSLQILRNERDRLALHSPWRWRAAISIGKKSTFRNDAKTVIEAYALTPDWLDLYGHRIRIEFLQFIRPQMHFDSSEALQHELADNIETVKALTGQFYDHDTLQYSGFGA